MFVFSKQPTLFNAPSQHSCLTYMKTVEADLCCTQVIHGCPCSMTKIACYPSFKDNKRAALVNQDVQFRIIKFKVSIQNVSKSQ